VDVSARTAGRVRGWALARPHVAVLAAPHRQILGWRVEAAVLSRGWTLADSPADTDVLVVAGDPEHLDPALLDATRRWWHHLTSPRAQVGVQEADQVAEALDAAHALLLDRSLQPEPASRSDEVATLLAERDSDQETGHDTGHDTAEHGGHDMGGDAGHDVGGDAGHDVGGDGGHEAGHDMGGHDGHDMGGHGGHDMGSVAGLPMAGTGEDRDGLALDVLTYRLGPFLPGWPPGLVVAAILSGDVVVAAEVERGPDRSATEAVPRAPAVAHALAAVVGLAGWSTASQVLAGARLLLLEGRALTPVQRRWLTRVRRSRTLGWVLRDVGTHDGRDAADRVREWCSELLDAPDRGAGATSWSLVPDSGAVEPAVVGTELARARIAVASLSLTAVDGAGDCAVDRADAPAHRHRSAS